MKNKSNLNLISAGLLILIVLLSTWMFNHIGRDSSIFSIIISFLITLLFINFLIYAFGPPEKSFSEFIIGDEGSYSLSRLQAILWSIIIISFEINVILSLFVNNITNSLRYYDLMFSESSIWLLGLSLTSYITTKRITNDKITKNPELYKKRSPKWGDLLMGDNGLDYSRCQLLIWTIIGIFLYLYKSYDFTRELQIASGPIEINHLLNNMYDEYAVNNGTPPYQPYLPWSFVVLMGLGQGVYIGKKLIPTFKLNDVKNAKQNELENETNQLEIKKQLLTTIVSNSESAIETPLDTININALKSNIDQTQNKINELKKTINEINQYKA
jgi:hypothetical protein